MLRLYADDVAFADLRRIVDETYTAAVFRSDDITPLREVSPGVHILGLSILSGSHVPLIREVMAHVAHVPIRHRGTVVGSLCHADAAAEMPLVLVLVRHFRKSLRVLKNAVKRLLLRKKL